MAAIVSLAIFIGLYLVVDFGRLIKRRLPPDYLNRAFWRTLSWLVLMEASLVGLNALIKIVNYSVHQYLYIVISGQILASLVILASTLRHLKTIRPPALTKNYASIDLPTLSVCVPARNETDDLEACLQSLVASDYPKLEILVLDDSSQNRRTPEIIRSFAQAGVRFMAGKEPPDRWLAKNYAYKQLADAANGEVLLFCGVDTRFGSHSLNQLVRVLLQKQKSMISLIPRNQVSSETDSRSVLIQPSRYAWELALPRRLLNRPPVLSTCWLINHGTLRAAGGFDAVSHQAVPESYLARYATTHDDGYSFMEADGSIGLTSSKSFDEQLSTALRTRYPQLHRRPEVTALISLLEVLLLVAPIVIFVTALASNQLFLAVFSLVPCLTLTWHYSLIVRLTYRRFLWRSLFMLPLAVLYDVWLLNYSMLKYEFGVVLWKDRNISMPVMRATLDSARKL